MDKNSKSDGRIEYQILKPFRLAKRWVLLNEKTIRLHPRQASFLLLNEKIAKIVVQPTKAEVK